MKRVVVCGSRDFNDYEIAKEFIKECLEKEKTVNEIIILSGGARGAGPIRNKKMAEACDIAICFWDGQSRGTKSMISCAEKLGKTVYVKRI